MSSLKFSILGGQNEIGGNKILLEYKTTKLMLDFGLSFSTYKKYFAEFLQPRKCNALLDWLEFGLLPQLNGIYRKDYCFHCNLKYPEKPFLDAVLLTHAHIDHSALIHFLRKDIPILCTQETFLILKALEETSTQTFMELTNLKKEFHLIRTKKSYKRLQGEEAKSPRKFLILKPYKKYQVKDMEIQALPVDHSLPGACAFIIYTDAGNVVYTGDLRFHGRRGELTKKFVERAKQANPKLMFCEGTRINENRNITEEEVERKCERIISNTKNLVVVNYPLRDLDRLLTFFHIAKKSERKLVVNLKQAYLLKLFENFKNYPKLEEVAVYIDRKGWGLISDEFWVFLEGRGWIKANELDERQIKQDYYKWEREFFELENRVTYKDIRENPGDFILRCDNFELNELIDIKPKGGVYIRSMTEPFSDDMLIEERRVRNWLKHFNLLPIHQIHASGHANGIEIKGAIGEIQPEKLIPIHTEHPELFFQ